MLAGWILKTASRSPRWHRGVRVALLGVTLLGCRAEDVVAVADSSVVAGAFGSGGTAGASGGGAEQGGSQSASCGGDCASGSCADGKCTTTLSVYYTTSSRIASAPSVRPSFEIHNEGSAAVPLSELEIRYFFTNEGSGTPNGQCPLLQPECDVLQLSFGLVQPARPLADSYLSVSFSASAPTVAAGSSSARYEVSFRSSDIGPLQQSNDYSFDPSLEDFAPSEKTCLYRNGKLVWGVEPPP